MEKIGPFGGGGYQSVYCPRPQGPTLTKGERNCQRNLAMMTANERAALKRQQIVAQTLAVRKERKKKVSLAPVKWINPITAKGGPTEQNTAGSAQPSKAQPSPA